MRNGIKCSCSLKEFSNITSSVNPELIALTFIRLPILIIIIIKIMMIMLMMMMMMIIMMKIIIVIIIKFVTNNLEKSCFTVYGLSI